MNLTGLELSILVPAFLAGLLILASHVPLGTQVLARGIVFIDLAIAQIAGLGVIIAGMAELDPQGWLVQIAAAAAALLGALLLTWTEQRWPEVQEALIGALFVLAATGGILLLAHNPHGGEHLRDLLAGQILWVRYQQLLIPGIETALIVAALFFLKERLNRLGFYLLFALAITASVQLVGVYLVFASLIIPSLGARNYSHKMRLPLAYLIGIIGYALGLISSTLFDLPSGALVVWCLGMIAIFVYALGAKKVVRRPGLND